MVMESFRRYGVLVVGLQLAVAGVIVATLLAVERLGPSAAAVIVGGAVVVAFAAGRYALARPKVGGAIEEGFWREQRERARFGLLDR